ncbi:MAG: muconate cycloisomerase [Planctomycetaceae bacterium]|nr:muconate cycloisomerase [Planctomycetaceae bacterium]
MRITHLETYAVRIPLKAERRMISALGQHIVSEYVLVRITTDTGLEGVGEATVMPRWSGETVWGARSLIDRVFAPLLVGRDPQAVAEIDDAMDRACAHNWFAKSAIEMACWDIQGKAAGEPVYKLLGGPHRPLAITCRFSMGAYEPERARRRARELVAEGFETIKVKVGGEPAHDIERVRIVREEIGPDRQIVIDANCGWDADTAIRCVNALADCRISLVEQPTPDGDYAAIARVRREIEPPVMADDMCFNLIHARELIRNAGCDVISLYPGKNGGIRKSKEIADYAAKHGVACSIGSNLEWDIATAAMGHLVVGCANMQVEKYPGDMLGPEYHEVRIARNPLEIRGPVVTITDRPGLGIDVDWDVVRKMGRWE